LEINYTIGIVTAPRAQCYISVSLQTLLLQRLPDPIDPRGITVFCEPGADVFLNHSIVNKIVNQTTLDLCLNWCNAVDTFLKDETLTHIIMCEDDVYWLDGSLKAALLQIQKTPDCIVSPYCSYTNGSRKVGWNPWIADHNLNGALTMFLPIKVLKHGLLEYVRNNHYDFEGNTHIDSTIGVYCDEFNIPVMLHTPSLVRHIGHVSTRRIYQGFMPQREPSLSEDTYVL
jgi:hypothetical protein